MTHAPNQFDSDQVVPAPPTATEIEARDSRVIFPPIVTAKDAFEYAKMMSSTGDGVEGWDCHWGVGDELFNLRLAVGKIV